MTLKLDGLCRLYSKCRASLSWTLSPIAVSAIFTGRLCPPPQRRPVKHAETENGHGVQARDALQILKRRQRPFSFLEGAETQTAFLSPSNANVKDRS